MRRDERMAGGRAARRSRARPDRLHGVAQRHGRPRRRACCRTARRSTSAGKRVRYLDTPHIPHGWEAGVLYEETTGTLLCGDLFTQLGDGPALTDERHRRAGDRRRGHVPLFQPQPRHGRDDPRARGARAADAGADARPSFAGDGAAALRALADDYDRRVQTAWSDAQIPLLIRVTDEKRHRDIPRNGGLDGGTERVAVALRSETGVAQEIPQPFISWRSEKDIGRASSAISPPSMKRPVGDVAGEPHLVCDDQHRHAVGGQRLDGLPAPPDEFRIERRGDFVEQHEAWRPWRARAQWRRAAAGRLKVGSMDSRMRRSARPTRVSQFARTARAPRASARPVPCARPSMTLPAAVRCGNRLKLWNTMPSMARWRASSLSLSANDGRLRRDSRSASPSSATSRLRIPQAG